MSVLFAARPRTGGTRSAGRHRPFTCQHWRSKDCNLKRAAPSDVWGNLCIIVTTRKVLAKKSRWLMGFPLDRCEIAPAIAAILAPTSLALFPWNRTDHAEYSIFKVQKVLFTIHAKYEIFFVGCHSFFKSSLQACGSTTGFGVSPQICVWISKRYASKTICQQVGALGPLFRPSRWEKTAGRVNHAMIHSLPIFPAYSENVNHSMIHV